MSVTRRICPSWTITCRKMNLFATRFRAKPAPVQDLMKRSPNPAPNPITVKTTKNLNGLIFGLSSNQFW